MTVQTQCFRGFAQAGSMVANRNDRTAVFSGEEGRPSPDCAVQPNRIGWKWIVLPSVMVGWEVLGLDGRISVRAVGDLDENGGAFHIPPLRRGLLVAAVPTLGGLRVAKLGDSWWTGTRNCNRKQLMLNTLAGVAQW